MLIFQLKNQPLSRCQKGEIAEILFDAKMISIGVKTLKPSSSYSRYDRVIDVNGVFLKVQIKSVHLDVSRFSRYRVRMKTTYEKFYKRSDVDMFAIYIHCLDRWHFEVNNEVGAVSLCLNNLKDFWDVEIC